MEKIAERRKQVAGSQTRQIATDALFVALTLVFTAFVNVQIPAFGGAGGLIHLGNVPLFIGAMIYGKRTGALAGGLGMGLFDILSGWAAWAPCTMVTCGLMGAVVGLICGKWKGMATKVVAVLAALVIKVAGYYVFESFVLGNGAAAAVKSIPGNIVQVALAALIVFVVIAPIEKGLRYVAER